MANQDHTSFESTCVADQQTLGGNVLLCNSSAAEQPGSGTLKILVLAQDLACANIQRRIEMLCAGGARVKVAGFRRTPKPVGTVAGCRAVDFGQTFDARFSQRIGAVLRTVIGLRRYEALFADVDLVVARNLEMVAIGARGRGFCKKPLPVLLYECIDIHRLMLSRGPAGMALRWLERRLSRRAAAIINSSPAFTHYFHRIADLKNPIRLVENKVLDIKEETPLDTKVAPRTPGPPWII